MFERIRVGWGLAIACAAAVLWAIDLTVLEPAAEPSKSLPDGLAQNNTYWARDLRVMALVAVLGGIVLMVRGERVRSWLGVVGTVLWLGVDVGLDRLDVRGPTAAFVIAGAACGALLAAGVLARGRAGRDTDLPVGADRPPGGGLLFAACMTAAVAPLAAGIESPTDTEAGLTPTAVAAAALLILAALGCALAAGPKVSRPRALAAIAVTAAAGVLVTMARIASAGTAPRLLAVVVLGVVVLTAVAGLGQAQPFGGSGLAAFGATTLLLYPVVVLGSSLFMIVSGLPARLLTELAGNSAVNAADSDLILAFAGIFAGLAFALVVNGFSRKSWLAEPASMLAR